MQFLKYFAFTATLVLLLLTLGCKKTVLYNPQVGEYENNKKIYNFHHSQCVAEANVQFPILNTEPPPPPQVKGGRSMGMAMVAGQALATYQAEMRARQQYYIARDNAIDSCMGKLGWTTIEVETK